MTVTSTAAPACRVGHLRLHHFRNYAEQAVDLGPGLNVVSGRNAQGKTNLLEAVAALALTRSPRAASAVELISWGEDACRIEAMVDRPDGPTALDMRVQRTDAGDRAVRTTLVDGKPRPARSLLGVCPVVLFWPDDLMLVKGGPEGRRRLLDVVLAQTDPRAAAELVRYRRVLEQRNALLRQVRLGAASPGPLPGFTRELARAGGFVQVARSRLVDALAPLASAALAEISDGDETLGIRYVAEGLEGGVADDPDGAAAQLTGVLASRAAEETARGVTVAGPHRDDVEMLIDGRPARTTASQGQQRSVVLACKLAEVRHVAAVAGMSPVLLLDDVLSELDTGRRERLLAALGAGRGAQALITTAEDAAGDLVTLPGARHFTVSAGRVSPSHAG